MPNNELIVAALSDAEGAGREGRDVNCPGFSNEEIKAALFYLLEKHWIRATIVPLLSGDKRILTHGITDLGKYELARLQAA